MATTPNIGTLGARLDLTVRIGCDLQPHVLTVKDRATGAPVDMSGSTFVARVKRDASDVDVLAAVDITLLTDGSDGKLLLRLLASETAKLPKMGQYPWDAERVMASGETVPAFYGFVKAAPNV